jgi:hypothetical protein
MLPGHGLVVCGHQSCYEMVCGIVRWVWGWGKVVRLGDVGRVKEAEMLESQLTMDIRMALWSNKSRDLE